jgi:hypothetical protein
VTILYEKPQSTSIPTIYRRVISISDRLLLLQKQIKSVSENHPVEVIHEILGGCQKVKLNDVSN